MDLKLLGMNSNFYLEDYIMIYFDFNSINRILDC
jgi:hypothetical protein